MEKLCSSNIVMVHLRAIFGQIVGENRVLHNITI